MLFPDRCPHQPSARVRLSCSEGAVGITDEPPPEWIAAIDVTERIGSSFHPHVDCRSYLAPSCAACTAISNLKQRNHFRASRALGPVEFAGDGLTLRWYVVSQARPFGLISTKGDLEQYPLLAERVECSARTKVSPRSGAVLTLGRRLRGRLHDATQTTPVSALKRAQAPSARAEPADGCCSRGSSSRS